VGHYLVLLESEGLHPKSDPHDRIPECNQNRIKTKDF
jgi:hypothetical protein